jgi:hypothetical protein
MKKFRFALPAVILCAGLTVSSVSFAKPEYTKKENGAKCAVCHTKGKELNKVGECYKTNKSLKACQEPK